MDDAVTLVDGEGVVISLTVVAETDDAEMEPTGGLPLPSSPFRCGGERPLIFFMRDER